MKNKILNIGTKIAIAGLCVLAYIGTARFLKYANSQYTKLLRAKARRVMSLEIANPSL